MGAFDDLPEYETPESLEEGSAFADLPDVVDDPGLAEKPEPPRGKRFIADLPERIAAPRNRIPVVPPEEAVLAASGAPAPALPPEVAPATPPAPAAVPAGPLSRAREVMSRQVAPAPPVATVPPAVAPREITFPVYDYPAESMTQVGEMGAGLVRGAVEGFTFLPRMAAAGAAGLILLGQGKSRDEAAAKIQEVMAGTSTETMLPMSETEKQILEVLSSPFKAPEAAVDAALKKFPDLANYPATLTAMQSIAEAAMYLAPFRKAIRGEVTPSRLHKKAGETISSWTKEDVRSILRATDEATIDPQLLDAFKKLPAEAKATAIKESGVRIEQLDPSVLGRVLGVEEVKNVIRLGSQEVPEAPKRGVAGALPEEGESAFSDLPAEVTEPEGPAPPPAGIAETTTGLREQKAGELRSEDYREAAGIEPAPAPPEQKQPPPSAPAGLFTRDRDTEGRYLEPDFEAIVDRYYDEFPSAHDQPRDLVEKAARETWKRSLWNAPGTEIPDQTLFERVNRRATAEMAEAPGSAPSAPTATASASEPPAKEKEAEGLLDSEEGFLDVSFLKPGIEAGSDVKAGVSSLLLPTAKSPAHLRAAEVLGSKLGASHRDAEVAATSLGKESRTFDKIGVHNPGIPLAQNVGVKFMSDMSQGRPMTPELQRIADKVKNLFDDRLRKLEQAGVELRTVRENYFPGMWKQKTEAVSFLSKQNLKGKESFRKHKVFDDIMEGIDAGLEPISNNPLDLVKLKLHEMDRSIMANRALREWEKTGDVKFLRIGRQMPEGFARINDKYGTVYGPPVQTVSEHVDKAVYDGLTTVAEGLGISPERRFSAGRSKLGYASPSGETVTQFATELSVLAHEIGHQLDYKYGLWDKIVAGAVDVGKRGKVTETASAKKRGKIQDELRALSDLTWEGSDPSKYYKQKVRKRAEKMAHMLEAYIHAPDRFKEVAPTVYADFDAFLKGHDELKGLSEIRQGLALEKISVEKPVGGFPVIGYRIATKPVAEILNNFLSSSLYNSPYFGTAFKAYMGMANLLNQSQLGVGSAFHAGFTSADVQISHNAEVVKDIYGVIRGNRTVGDLGRTIKKVPAAIITNPRRGAKVVREWRTPTLEVPTNVPVGQLPQGNDARVAMIAKAMELAGGASRIERGLKTEWTEAQIREWYGNQKVKAAMRTPIVLVELLAKPIMEWLVPRQKAGVFGELAGRIIEQNPGKTMEELIPKFRQAWNRVDARLGQVVYDRLFINNIAKNVIQGAIRAPGWTGGTIGEVITGAPKDLTDFFSEWWRTKKAPENIPDRVAYVIALLTTVAAANGLLTKAFTGDDWEDIDGMDWWAFRTTGFDENGRAERFLLPTYMKDLFSWWQDWGKTLLHKTHPLIGVMGDVWRNRDYYGVEIANEDDPWVKQQIDRFVKYPLKQFEPFWIRGARREAERGGGGAKTLKEAPQKLLAPQLGVMPAPQAYTMSKFEKYARKIAEERRPLGTRTQEQADKGRLKHALEMKLRRGDPDAEVDLAVARATGEISRREEIEIKRRAKEDPIAKVAKSMTLEDLANGIELATEAEKEVIRPIFKNKLYSAGGEIDRETRVRYRDILEGM